MTYTKEVTLWCEGDCAEWIQLNDYDSAGGKVLSARLMARRYRWTFAGGKDYCPAHSASQQGIVHDPILDAPHVTLADIPLSTDKGSPDGIRPTLPKPSVGIKSGKP